MLYCKISIIDMFSIPCIIVVAASASRKAMIIVLLGIFLLLIVKNSGKSFIKNIIKYVVISFLTIIVFYIISEMSIFSGMRERMDGLFSFVAGEGDVDSSTLKRADFMKAAFEQFLENPILGIGMDNAKYVIAKKCHVKVYSHNNFTEILCNGGIVGFLIYYSMYIHLLFNFWKNRKNNINKLCLILTVIFLVLDWASVGYYSKLNYFYFMMLFLQARINC